MNDSIDEKLELKFGMFVALLGAWFYLMKYYLTLIPITNHSYWAWVVLFFSYVVFYPLWKLGFMLVYSSFYQITEKPQIIEELKKYYTVAAKDFWSWWGIMVFVLPISLLVTLFKNIYINVIITLVSAVFLIFYCYKKKFFSFDNVKGTAWKLFLSFVLYIIFFGVIVGVFCSCQSFLSC